MRDLLGFLRQNMFCKYCLLHMTMSYSPCEVPVHSRGAPWWHSAAASAAVPPLSAAFDVYHLRFSRLQPLASLRQLVHV